MWTFEVKTSTLLVMMTTVVLVFSAVVHPAPDPCKELLHKMKEELQHLDNATLDNIQVPKPTQVRKTCPKDFFCLAEKVLESIQDEPDKTTLSNLTEILKRYNEKSPTKCHLDLNKYKTYPLLMFLKDVKECLKFAKCNKQ